MTAFIKLLVCLVFLAAIGGGFTACHTLQGAGKDLEEAGEAMEDAVH